MKKVPILNNYGYIMLQNIFLSTVQQLRKLKFSSKECCFLRFTTSFFSLHKTHQTKKKTVYTYNLYFHIELCCKDSHSWGYREDAIEKGIIRQTCMVHHTVTLVQEFYHFSAQKGQHQAGERREVEGT